jgi:hypothetical protein
MTDAGTPVEVVAHILRVATANEDDDRIKLAPDDPAREAKLTAWRKERLYRAWREMRYAHDGDGHRTGGELELEATVADYAHAVSTATRWSDAIVADCGIDDSYQGDPVFLSAARSAVAAGLIWLIAHDGAHAASVIADECRIVAQRLRAAYAAEEK